MPAYRCCSLPFTCLGCVSSMWLLAGKVLFATGQAKHALGSKPAPRKTNAHASTHTASLRDSVLSVFFKKEEKATKYPQGRACSF